MKINSHIISFPLERYIKGVENNYCMGLVLAASLAGFSVVLSEG